ncbi:MAG: hypothetical protein MRERV_75c004 [Mycoplasmataceae bacterium RV_VA103A]|nr:MAG: hypothetical protein MRERV_75c004 [Mycoplasmataceae bacterium RV_VA103A]
MNDKTFIFKYEPDISLKQMGKDMQKAVQIGKPSVHLRQISFSSIEDIMEEIVSPRPKLFACLVENKPQSLDKLAQLLERDYAEVYKDLQSLSAMGIVKLEEAKGKIKPIPLYERIVFDFQVKKTFPS